MLRLLQRSLGLVLGVVPSLNVDILLEYFVSSSTGLSFSDVKNSQSTLYAIIAVMQGVHHRYSLVDILYF